MKKIVFIVGLFYSVLAMAEGQVNCVSSRDEISGQVTSNCTVKETSGDFTTDFLKKYGANDLTKGLINIKPVEDPYKMASDIVNQKVNSSTKCNAVKKTCRRNKPMPFTRSVV